MELKGVGQARRRVTISWKATEGSGGRAINEVIEAGNPSLSHPSLMTRPELHCLRRGSFRYGDGF